MEALAPPDPRLEPERVSACLRAYVSARRRRRIERVLDQRLIGATVVLEHPQDPHNGAAVLRSCEALGLVHVHVIAGSAGFAFSHKVTQNAHKWLNVYLHGDTRSCLARLAGWGFRCLAAAPPTLGSRVNDDALDLAGPVALVFGNEHGGLSAEAFESCERRFHLPMYGFSESLNLSVSAALALSRLVAQRRARLGRPGDLPKEGRARLRAAYYLQSVRCAADIVLRQLEQPVSGG